MKVTDQPWFNGMPAYAWVGWLAGSTVAMALALAFKVSVLVGLFLGISLSLAGVVVGYIIVEGRN